MEFDKLSEYADQQALLKQTQFILDLFEQIETKGTSVAEKLKGSFSLLDNKNSGTKALADDFEHLALTSARYQKILAAVAGEVDNFSEAQKKMLKDINEQFKLEEQQRAGAKETLKLIATEISQNEKLEAGRSALARTIALNRVELQQQNKELTQAAKLKLAEVGSNQRLDATIAFLTTRLNKLNQATDEGRKKAEQYQKSIGKLFELRKQQADPKTAQALNIGNYQGSAKIIVDAMEAARRKVEQVSQEFGKLSTEAATANREFTALKRITDQPQFLNISAKVGDTNAELKFFVKQLNQLEDSGLKNSAVYKDVQGRLAQLTDQIGDTRAEVKALSSDTRGFDLFAGSVSFAADAFQTAAGAAQLFGASEKDAQKATATLVAIQSVSNGLKGIANELTTKGTAANKAFAFMQGLVGKAMDATAEASVRLRAALLATGVGALVIGLGVLISKLGIFGDDTDKAAEEADKLTKSFERQKKAIDEVNESLEFQGKIQQEKLKQARAGEDKLFEAELSTKQKQLANLKKLEKDSQDERLGAVKQFEGDLGKVYSKLGNKFELSEDTKKAALDRFKQYNDNVAANTLARVNKENEIELFKETRKTKIAEDGFAKQDERDKKAVAQAKKNAEEALKLQVEKEKRKAEAVANIVKENINQEIKLNELIVESDKSTLDEKLLAADKVSKAKTALLSIEYSEAIAAEIKVEDGKRVIVEKTADEKLLAETKYQNSSTNLLAETLKKQEELRKADAERQKEAFAELKKQLGEGADNFGENEKNITAIRRNKKLLQLDADFLAGRIKNVEEYEKKKKAITEAADKKDIQAALEVAYQKLEIAILFGDDTKAIEKDITALNLQLMDLEVDKAKTTAEKKLEIEKGLAEKKKELFSAVKDLLIAIVDGQFERQKNQIQELIQLNEDQKNAEIERVQQSTASEQDKVTKIALINAEAQQKKEALEKRQRQIELQKAEFDRLVSIAEVVANTAEAVTNDLIKNKALIPIDIAIGAAQIAAILARPLPKFKDGLFDDYEGWAITGDGGRSEVIKRKAGGIEVTPATDTLTWINKGDRIDPDADSFFKSMQMGAISNAARIASDTTQEENYAKHMVNALESGLKANANKIVAALDGIPKVQMGATKGGLEALWKHGANSIKYITENTNWNS